VSCLAVVSAALAITGCTEGGDLVEGSDSITINNDSSASGGGSGNGGDTGGNNGGNNGGDNGGDNGGNNGGVAGAFFDEGGFLLNQNIHPLQDNLDPTGGASPTIMPASTASCPMGTTDTGTTVVMFDDGAFFEGGDFNPEFPVCALNDDLRADGGPTTYTLTNDHVYLLTTAVIVGNGGEQDITAADAEDVTLEIESGTQIFGQAGQRASLRITRGSTINIMGTLDEPVMMTGVEATTTSIIGDPTDLTGRGDWGGLVIDGYAPTNITDAGNGGDANNDVPNEGLSEAAPTGQTNVHFGGGDPDDSSGTITYVVIGESGVSFRPDAELQGLTLEGVGRGTTIENVQIFGSDDDGIEWFGGTVNVSNIVINGQDDDGLDIDQGYQGVIKNAIVRQGSLVGDTTSEADGNGSAFDRAPQTRPVLANVLLLGDGDDGSLGLNMREGYGADFENVVLADTSVVSTVTTGGAFALGCFFNDDEVDEDLNARGIAFFCANDSTDMGAVAGQANVMGNLYPTWANGDYDDNGPGGAGTGADGMVDGQIVFNAMEDDTLTVDGNTYVVTTTMSPDGTVVEADAYMGAVNPTGTPYWMNWTVHLANSN
jgi:hypothetical protein